MDSRGERKKMYGTRKINFQIIKESQLECDGACGGNEWGCQTFEIANEQEKIYKEKRTNPTVCSV